jgi:hypothetical protein
MRRNTSLQFSGCCLRSLKVLGGWQTVTAPLLAGLDANDGDEASVARTAAPTCELRSHSGIRRRIAARRT